jgi:hypothetical protein
MEERMEEANSQMMNMIRQLMEKNMLQLNEKMDQNRKDLKDVADHLSDRLSIVEETIKKTCSRTSSRATSRATSPVAGMGAPTVTRIQDLTDTQLSTPIPKLGSKRMFTPTTTYKQQDLETLLQNIEIDTKIPQRRGERRETVYGEVTRSCRAPNGFL